MRISLFLLLTALMVPIASAGPMQWSVFQGTFTDGATITGTFVFDSSTKAVSSWNIQVGAGANFTAYTYSSSDPAGVGFYNGFGAPATEAVIFQDANTARTLVFQTLGQLTTPGSTVALDVANSSIECFNCDPFRFIASGSLVQGGTSGVPEPASVLVVSGALVWGWWRRRG